MKRLKLGKINGETFVKEDFERIGKERHSEDFYDKEELESRLENDEINPGQFWFTEGYLEEAR